MNDLSREEFAALRATIRQRGTARVWIFFSAVAAWSALILAIALFGGAPVFTLIPLLVLAAGFEAVFNLHVGVERVGRYLQAFSEAAADGPRWETTAMAFGRGFRAVSSDPLFIYVFLIAAFLNLLPSLGDGVMPAETATIVGAHLVFAGRLVLARRAAASQRAADLERYRALKNTPHS